MERGAATEGSSSPARNRVTPLGDIEAFPLRGAWTGNRGVLHRGHEIVRFHAGDLWITCALEFRGRRREQWLPNRFTWLYFHDEAVSLAAGHRPCAECRWQAYRAYRSAWAEGLGTAPPVAKEMNRRLHGERIFRGTHRRRLHAVPWTELPDGAFVLDDDGPAVVLGDRSCPGPGRDTGRRAAPADRGAVPPRRSRRRPVSPCSGPATRSRSIPTAPAPSRVPTSAAREIAPGQGPPARL